MADILYTDTGGTTRALWGESVALIDDQSTNDNNASQASAALRGAVGRAAVGAAPSATLDGGSGPAFLRMDLSDDAYPAAVPDGTYDVFVAGRGGSWIERDVVVSGGAGVTIGPTGIAGRNPGILSVLGGNPGNWADIVAIEVVDRTITASELTGLVSYYRERGAKGLLVPGPELVTNGTFDTDTSGWSENNAILSVQSGALRVGDNGQWSNAHQGVTTASGATYIVSVDYIGASGLSAGRIGWASTAPNVSYGIEPFGQDGLESAGTYSFLFQASASEMFIVLGSEGTDYADYDNISVRELVPEEEL